MPKESLEQFFGFLWPMVKPLISGVTLNFDTANKCLVIIRGDQRHSIPFADIENITNGK